MNILDKNILTVVMATLISSGMIVITENSIAEEKVEASTDKVVSLKKQVGVVTKKLETINEQEKEVVAKGSTTINANVLSSPPPGPFYDKGGASFTQKALSAPVAPKEPVSLLKQPKLEQRANSLHFNSMPVITKKVTEPKADLSKPTAPVKPSMAPKLTQNPPEIDQKIEKVSILSQTPKQKKMPALKVAPPILPKTMVKKPEMKPVERPIWMEKGNISGQKINTSSKNTSGQNQAVMGMPNMGWGNPYPAQRYIYIPVPVMPSNMMPPQVPMFNHNIIPPSNYWGVPQLPNNIQGTVMKKGSVEGTSAPVQKGNE